MSKPHFLDGAEELREAVDGLQPPDRNRDETTIDLEPTIAANLEFQKQIQINVQVNQTSDFR